MNDKPKYLIESEIAVRKQMLTGTDYQALKFAGRNFPGGLCGSQGPARSMARRD